MPFLKVRLLRDRITGGAVYPEARQLVRPGRPLGQCQLRAQVVAGGEIPTARSQDHHPNGVVGLGSQERLVELNKQAAALRVVRVRPVKPDPGDAAVVERFVGHQVV